MKQNKLQSLVSEGHVIVLFSFLFKKNFGKNFSMSFNYLDTMVSRCYGKFSYAA